MVCMRSSNGDADIDVVVEFDLVLAGMGAKEPADVLDAPILEREGEGEQQGVEYGPVEALAEVGADDDDPVLVAPGRDCSLRPSRRH